MRKKKTVNNLKMDKNVVNVSANKNMFVKKISKKGALVALIGTISAFSFGCGKTPDYELPVDTDSDVTTTDENYSIETSTEALSSLNVVLVDDEIDDEQIDVLADELNNIGLETEVRDINSLNSEGNETFIALKNYGGDDLKVIGNYNNGNNHADLLAISMSCETGSQIQRGVNNFDGDVTRKVPSNIESITSGRIMPTVTLAVPYGQNVDSRVITDALARYMDYFYEHSVWDADYLVRGETSVYDFVQTYGEHVLSLNGLDRDDHFDMDAILFSRKLPDCFGKDVTVNVDIKDKGYSNTH